MKEECYQRAMILKRTPWSWLLTKQRGTSADAAVNEALASIDSETILALHLTLVRSLLKLSGQC